MLVSSLTEIVDITIAGFTRKTPRLSDTIQLYREVITEISELIKKRQILRFHQSEKESALRMLFVDICYTEEKLMDHCDTVADAMKRYSKETGSYEAGSAAEMEDMRKRVRALFKDKFSMLNESGNA